MFKAQCLWDVVDKDKLNVAIVPSIVASGELLVRLCYLYFPNLDTTSER